MWRVNLSHHRLAKASRAAVIAPAFTPGEYLGEHRASESGDAALEQSRTEAISVHCLITNRPIRFPIYDANRLLLLAEGSLITTKFRELLRARNITQVRLHDEDVRAVTLTEQFASGTLPEVGFDNDLTAKLHRIIESGNLLVANSGDALIDQMNRCGCRGYNREERERVNVASTPP